MIKTRLLITITLIFAISVFTAGAEESVVELDATDVNCFQCHEDIHVFHSEKGLQCEMCHGEKLDIRIPQCTNCHSGPIHNIHKRKVESMPCSGCHTNIEGKHESILGNSVCEHCHKDLIGIHGGELEACNRCHGSGSRITKPATATGMTVVCENCHQADSIATIHGSKDDAQTCYRCHREGVDDTETTKIPHIIHLPKVECMTCHWDLKEDSIVIPKCSECHSVDRIHAFSNIGNKMRGSVECSICHPAMSVQKNMDEITEIEGKPISTPEPTVVPTSTPPLTGFGLVSVLTVFGLLYFLRFRD